MDTMTIRKNKIMNEHSANTIQASIISVSIAATITAMAYFIIVVWWSEIVASSAASTQFRHETCYQEWNYNEAHQERWLRVDYCTHE
jgi:hypothetical protein